MTEMKKAGLEKITSASQSVGKTSSASARSYFWTARSPLYMGQILPLITPLN